MPMRFIAAPIMIVLGFLAMKYTVAITRTTGPIGFAEKYFSSFGGTYAWWRMLGFAILLLGLLWLTGVVEYSSNPTFQFPGTGEQAGQ